MKLLLYIKQHKVLSSTALSLICIAIVYVVLFNNRIHRFLEPMIGIKHIVNITPLSRNSKIMNGAYKLCDFHIAASYKSYLPCTNYMDYSSIYSIREILQCGCRYIDIDVMNSTFGNRAKPVVCNGNPVGNWHYTTALAFEDVIRFIMTFAFNGQVVNKDDPLILNINFNTWYNKDTINKCAEIITEQCRNKLLDMKYAYSGRRSGNNIQTTPIQLLLGKLIISTTSDVGGTKMEELVNIYHSKQNANIYKLTATALPALKDDLLYRLEPLDCGRLKSNYPFTRQFKRGCQIICMNYTRVDKHMLQYTEIFKNSAFVLQSQFQT